ncbi:MAG TPA: ATP-binding protein [Terriglobales bacterium]|nr:ATP-binding protein [Terriglobales bacterium]
MNFRLRTETWTGLLLLLALLLPVGIYQAAYRAGRQLSTSLGGANHSQEVMLAIDQVQLQMVRAMNAERQFQLSHDPAEQDAYAQAVAKTRAEIARLRRLTNDNPREKPALDQLQAATERQILNLARDEQLPASAATPLAALQSAQAVRQGAEASTAEEQRLLTERRAVGVRFLRRWSRLFWGGVMASVALLLIAFVLLWREVRRRRRAQEELNRSHLQLHTSWQHYDNLIAHVPAAVWSARADGRIQYLSPYMETLTGYTPLEIVSAGAEFWQTHLHPGDRAGAEASWRELFAGQGTTALEFRMRHRQGHWIWLQAQCRRTGGAGREATADGVLYDITAVKQRAELEMQERSFQFKNDVLASVSHELRTPLSAILGFSDLLAQGAAGPLSQDQQDFARHIHSSGEHLLALINDILDLSRIEAGQLRLQPAAVGLAAAVEEAVEIVAAHAQGKGVKVRTECGAGVKVWADPLRLRQIFCNLLGNAVKFTPAGGEIVVLAAVEGEKVRVTVRDNGIGIAPEHVDAIFDRFRQVDTTARQAGEGTGLGLAITRHLVTQHGGRIWVESRPGAGSAFHFTLPTAEAVLSKHQANAVAG